MCETSCGGYVCINIHGDKNIIRCHAVWEGVLGIVVCAYVRVQGETKRFILLWRSRVNSDGKYANPGMEFY